MRSLLGGYSWLFQGQNNFFVHALRQSPLTQRRRRKVTVPSCKWAHSVVYVEEPVVLSRFANDF